MYRSRRAIETPIKAIGFKVVIKIKTGRKEYLDKAKESLPLSFLLEYLSMFPQEPLPSLEPIRLQISFPTCLLQRASHPHFLPLAAVLLLKHLGEEVSVVFWHAVYIVTLHRSMVSFGIKNYTKTGLNCIHGIVIISSLTQFSVYSETNPYNQFSLFSACDFCKQADNI